jgi:hypothetical protein
MPVYPIYQLNYQRPVYVPPSDPSDDPEQSSVTETSPDVPLKPMPLTPKGIPEALSFDRVVSGGCCPVSIISSDSEHQAHST